MVKVVAFDFGGVLAEEGFVQGLKAIAESHRLDPEWLIETATELVFKTGYVTGAGSEHAWWDELRGAAGIVGDDAELRREILSRFVIRDDVQEMVRWLRRKGLRVVILSDQTDWLRELDARTGFGKDFDGVFNSYDLGRTKRDPFLFDEVRDLLGVAAEEILFVDDNPGNVARAESRGWKAIGFSGPEGLRRELCTVLAREAG